MTDIIDIFLGAENAERLSREVSRGANQQSRSEYPNLRALMHEFAYGPHCAGLFDILTGSDANTYLRHMNQEFLKYVAMRTERARDTPAMVASYLNPFAKYETQMADPPHHNADMLSRRLNRDLRPSMHLMSRDDEASDVGFLPHTKEYAEPLRDVEPLRLAEPLNARDFPAHARDESAEYQYHILALDSQMSVLNRERTIPLGYGDVAQQNANAARYAARYAYLMPETGVIPKTSYKKITHVIPPHGRVTLDDDRIMARDIFARDSKGCLAMRH